MRYLKSTALLLLTLGSSASVLSRSAIAQLAKGVDSASLADELIADQFSLKTTEASAVGNGQTWPGLESPRQDVQRAAPDDLMGNQLENTVAPLVSDVRSPQLSDSKQSASKDVSNVASDKAPTSSPNRLSLDQFRALTEQANSAQTETTATAKITDTASTHDSVDSADSAKIVVADQTTTENRTEQIAQTEDLPVLEEETPPATAAP